MSEMTPLPQSSSDVARSKPRLLLVGWDSADWKVIHPLVDRGEMPMLRRILEGGVSGKLRTLEPMLSPMLWTSIATGRRAYDHGVLGFTEVEPLTRKIQPVTAGSRTCNAVWNILAAQGLKCHVLGWFATQGEQIPHGGVVSDLFTSPTAPPGHPWPPAPGGTIWPESNARALNDMRVSPEDLEADTVGLFVPRWAEVDQANDHRLSHLRIHMAEAFSIQAAACWTLENTEWDFVAVYYRAIDELSHHFMPFHPPRLDGVPERDFELYRGVIESAYRIHDLMLARLIALAPEDTHVMVVSDHGFHSDHLRPKFVPRVPAGITVWHREHGILAAAGPRFGRDELLHGAGLLDVAPTILHLFDLPVGEDMEGRVLLDAFVKGDSGEAVASPRSIPTWEGVAARSTVSVLSENESRALLEQFAALGYVEKPTGDPDTDAATVQQENEWTLARALIDGGRFRQALPHLEALFAREPGRTDFAQTLARCQTHLGLFDEAAATIDATLETFGNVAVSAMLRAQMALERHDAAKSLQWLEQARAASMGDPRFWRQIGLSLVQLRRWQEAEESFQTLLGMSPDDAVAHLGMAICHLWQGRTDEAVEEAITAVALDFTLARAHFVLARALLRRRELERAEQALRVTLRFAPASAHAHHLLAAICRATQRWDEALEHQAARVAIVARREEQKTLVEQLRLEIQARAAERRQNQANPISGISGSETAGEVPAAEPLQSLDIVIVSGLPRSGTSLMMQMLQAGDHPILSDGVRPADANNERGYFEWEAARELPRRPQVIEQASGKAVKIITALLPHLPRQHRYKVVLMRRPLEEVALSQHKMRFQQEGDSTDLNATVVPMLGKHVEATRELLLKAREVALLEVDYPTLVRDPAPVIAALREFLGEDALPTPERMASVVDTALYRQRSR